MKKQDFKKETYPKAKKEYTCNYCGNEIYVEDIYCKVVGVYQGLFYSMKICCKCLEVRK